MEGYKRLEDLVVYQRLCQLHIAVSEVTHRWPAEERYELASQARRSSNSAPAQLAEKYDDRHLRNKIEGVSARSRRSTRSTAPAIRNPTAAGPSRPSGRRAMPTTPAPWAFLNPDP
jgi:hypothetical protein